MQLPAGTGDNSVGQDTQNTTTRQIKVKVVSNETSVPNANITITSTNPQITGQTGSGGGQATISNVPEGTQTITVSAEGYVTKTESIVIDSEHTTFEIELTAQAASSGGTDQGGD